VCWCLCLVSTSASVYVCVCTYVFVFVCLYFCGCECLCMYVYIYVYIHPFAHTYIGMNNRSGSKRMGCTLLCVRAFYMYARGYTYTYVHTYVHTHKGNGQVNYLHVIHVHSNCSTYIMYRSPRLHQT